uniref:Uncharacterized protein n=2 Tax=Caenorhabditis tropicalis TaxID=1561998 RepID=A0A1I7T1Z0_9PELO
MSEQKIESEEAESPLMGLYNILIGNQSCRSMLPQASPDVRLRATFHIMQGWWGEINLGFVPLTSTVVFNRFLEEIGTRLEVVFDAKDQDDSIVKFKIPIHHFTEVWHTDRKSASDLPTALVFHFTDEGFESFKAMLPGRVETWEPKLKEKKRVLSKSLLFVLDPSDFIMAEDGLLLYRPGFIEGIELFKLNYNEQWENHLCEQQGRYGEEFKDGIVPVDSQDFTAYYKRFGLRNTESEHLAGYKKKPIRIFIARRYLPRKSRRAPKRRQRRKPAANTNKEEEDEDKDEEEDGGEEEEEEDPMEIDPSQPGPSQPGPSTSAPRKKAVRRGKVGKDKKKKEEKEKAYMSDISEELG